MQLDKSMDQKILEMYVWGVLIKVQKLVETDIFGY